MGGELSQRNKGTKTPGAKIGGEEANQEELQAKQGLWWEVSQEREGE